MKRFARFTHSFLTGTECTEVLRLFLHLANLLVGYKRGKEREGRTVLGVTSENNSITILPALLPLTVMSKKTRGLGVAVILKLEMSERGENGEQDEGNNREKMSEDCPQRYLRRSLTE